jgi:hypothetical protein
LVNASNKIRLGSPEVSVIEGQVAFTFTSDKTRKENFKPVDGEEALGKIRGLNLRVGITSATTPDSSATTARWLRISSAPLGRA